MNAIHALATQEEDEALRRRQVELGSLCRDCELLAEEACREYASVPTTELRKAGYDPNEPRVPAGNPDGGEWTREGGSPGSRDNRIRAYDIPPNNPMHPLPFVDSTGRAVSDDRGSPLLRPANLPPEMFVHAGLAASQRLTSVLPQEIPELEAAAAYQAMQALSDDLRQFERNGPWDAERFQGQYVIDYTDYATIAIGLYMAAAGVPFAIAVLIQQTYLLWNFRLLSEREIRDTEIGYELYQSGRISPGR